MRFLLLLLLFYACTEHSAAPAKPVPTAATTPPLKDTVQKLNPVLSTAQMDSFVHLKGRPVTASLWKMINVDRVSIMPDTVGVLSGNLDQDEEPELVIWYKVGNLAGNALCFDKRNYHWFFIGVEGLSFWRGDDPPFIDPALGALGSYGYGSGSGYGSKSLNFCQYKKDSLITVLNFLENESVRFFDGRVSSRDVEGKYQIVNKSKVLVHYKYELRAEEKGHEGAVFFRRRFTIPYSWDPQKQCFQPRFSKRFARLYGLPLENSENEFDGYFDAELDRMREFGPIWRRHALGNHADE